MESNNKIKIVPEDKEFEPYGAEWEKAMMKLPKNLIIEMLKGSLIRNHFTSNNKFQITK